MTEITQEGWKNKALSMLLAQLTSYVLLIAATVIPSPGTVPIIPLIIAALTLAAFVVFWPFRGSMLDRIVTLVFGAISLIDKAENGQTKNKYDFTIDSASDAVTSALLSG